MKIKKILCILLAFCLVPLLPSCSGGNAYALNIAGSELTQGVYAYFLDLVVSKPEVYGLASSVGEAELKAEAAELCKNYVAVNSTLKELNLLLADEEKAYISTNVNNLWRLYSEYYSAIGVTKQTLTKIETSNAAKECILLYYYDTSGTKAVSENDLRTYFSENYISFRAINGYLTKTAEDGSTVDFTPEEISALKSKLLSLTVRIADGESFEDVSKRFASEQGISSGKTDATIIKKDNNSYPSGFFDEVSKQSPDVPTVIMLDKYIFLVVRGDIFITDEEYANHRIDCLKDLKGGELDQTIASIAAEYPIKNNDRVINRLYKTIVANRNAEKS